MSCSEHPSGEYLALVLLRKWGCSGQLPDVVDGAEEDATATVTEWLIFCGLLCRPISCLGLHPCIASVLQLACIYGLGVLMVLCAYAGYTVTASILEVSACSPHCC